MAVIVKINQYLDRVISKIKELDTIHDCQLYAKQINFATKKVMNVPLKDGKATCYIEQVGAVADPVSEKVRRLMKNYTINVYIIAKNNRSSSSTARAGSYVCNQALDEIEALLFDEDFDLNIEEAKIVSSDLIDDTSEVYVEYSILYLQYTQRLTTHETKN